VAQRLEQRRLIDWLFTKDFEAMFHRDLTHKTSNGALPYLSFLLASVFSFLIKVRDVTRL
jgi:hypothetical protein